MLSCPLPSLVLPPPVTVRATPCVSRFILVSPGERERLLFRAPPEALALRTYGAKSSPSSYSSLPPHYTHLTIIRQGGLCATRPPAASLQSQVRNPGGLLITITGRDFPWLITSVAVAVGRSITWAAPKKISRSERRRGRPPPPATRFSVHDEGGRHGHFSGGALSF